MLSVSGVQDLLEEYSTRASKARLTDPEVMINKCARLIWQRTNQVLGFAEVMWTLDVGMVWLQTHGPKRDGGTYLRCDVEDWIASKTGSVELDDERIGADIRGLCWAAFGAHQTANTKRVKEIARKIICLGPERLFKRDTVEREYGFNPKQRGCLHGIKISDREVRWKKSEIEDWLSKRT